MSGKVIGILNYGAGNFGSVKRALEALEIAPLSVNTTKELEQTTHLIFPGVGSAAQAMNELRGRGLDKALKDYARSGRPLLGICVGMQVLGRSSTEGQVECLDLLPYTVDKFHCADPVPHMGWNSLDWQPSHPLSAVAAEGLSRSTDFYFVHSYAAFLRGQSEEKSFVLASAQYGGSSFAALVGSRNIWGAQCHLEKSGRAGLHLIKNFLNQRNF